MDAVLGTLDELAARIGAKVIGDGGVLITRVAAIGEAGPGMLTFATDARYVRAAYDSRAEAVLIDARLLDDGHAPGKPLLVVPSARVGLAQLLSTFERPRHKGPFRHPSAVIDETAVIGDEVYIGPQVVVGANTQVGDRTVLEAGVVIGDRAHVGTDGHFHPRALLLDDCVAGNHVVLQAGAVVGSDGFGFVPVERQLLKIPQIGIVELGDGVEIGANTCVDRAQTGVTKIGAGTKLDNLIQIGHNARIGMMTVIAGQSGIAGSAVIGDGVQIGGQSAVNGHISIGSGARVAGGSKVWQAVEPGSTVSGDPAQDHRLELRKKVLLKNLPKLVARLNALEKKKAQT
jgi:UDP-3-O-[3-hydroxymyristoyl] glucosamine N-acyltransferase